MIGPAASAEPPGNLARRAQRAILEAAGNLRVAAPPLTAAIGAGSGLAILQA